MSHILQEIIESMDYFSEKRSHTDWPRFLEFLELLGHDPMVFPLDIICDPDDICDYDFGPLFMSLPETEWSLYYDTREDFGTHDIILLWWNDGESQIIEFKFVESSASLNSPTIEQFDVRYLQHIIPLDDHSSATSRFQYLWYFLNRINPATETIELPLPELSRLEEGYTNAKKYYEGMLQIDQDRESESEEILPKKRKSPLRTSVNGKRTKIDIDHLPFPEFERESSYAHLFTPLTLEKYLNLLDRLQKIPIGERNVVECSFLDLLVKIQNTHLFSDDVYLIKKSKDFKKYFPTGSPKLVKLKNLAGFLFEMFTDLVAPPECKVIFGTWDQQKSILDQINKTPQGSLIDIVTQELGDEEYVWSIMQRYLLVRQGSDLTAST
jgi:hypothetical protein